MPSAATLKVMPAPTVIAAVLLGQVIFAAMCGVAWLMLAAAFRIWPSKLLRDQIKGSPDSETISATNRPDEPKGEPEEFLDGGYADLTR